MSPNNSSMFCIQPMPAVDAMLAIDEPSIMSGITARSPGGARRS